MSQVDLHQYLNDVRGMLNEGRYAAVVNHCRQILAAYPRHVETYRLLGKAFLSLKKYDDAIDIYQRVLSADPLDVGARVGLATAYKAQRKLPQAAEQMAFACELDPYNSSLHDRWQSLCREAQLPPPPDTPSRASLGLLNWRTGLYRPAIQALAPLVQEQPQRLDLQLVLAESYWRLDKKIEAAGLSEQILHTLPHSIRANGIVAEVWLRTGRVAQARRPLQLLQGLTQPTQTSCDPDVPEGRAFLTKGSIPVPKQLWVNLLDESMAYEEEEPFGAGEDEWGDEMALYGDQEPRDTADDAEVDFFSLLEANDGAGSFFNLETADEEPLAWGAGEDEEAFSAPPASDDSFDIFDFSTPASPLSADETAEDEADMPDWLSEMGTGDLAKSTHAPADDMPDWLSDTAETDPFQTADRPTWLADLEQAQAEDDDLVNALFMSDDELASLSREQDPFDPKQTPATPASTPELDIWAELEAQPEPAEDDFGFLTGLDEPTSSSPATGQGLDINAFVASSRTSTLPDWLSDLDDDGLLEAAPTPTPPPAPTPSPLADEDDFSFLDEDEPEPILPATAEDEPLTAVPDWMAEMSAPALSETFLTGLADEEQAGDEDFAGLGFPSDLPDWLQEPVAPSPAAADVPRPSAALWFDETEESAMPLTTPHEEEPFPLDFLADAPDSDEESEQGTPPWLALFDEQDVAELAEEMGQPLPASDDWLMADEPSAEEDDLAGWLEASAPAEGESNSGFTGWLDALDEEPSAEVAPSPLAASGFTDWLSENPLLSPDQPEASLPEPETADDDLLPDWLSDPVDMASLEEPVASHSGFTGWLQAIDDEAPPSSLDEATDDWLAEEAPAETAEPLPDWLGGAVGGSVADEALAWMGGTAEPADDLADWLAEPSDTADDDMDWLGETATAESDELPDWLGTPAPITAEAEPADELADWLAEPSDTADDGMDWLGETATAESDELPDWLGTSAPITAEAEPADDLADWLAEPSDTADDGMNWLGETATAESDELPDWLGTSAPITAEAEPADELADWLAEPSDTADDGMDWLGETATAESDELPDWLGTPAPITAEAEPADDLADWLAEPSDTADDGMDWLGETATAESDELPDWLGTSAPITAEAEPADDLAGWLAEPSDTADDGMDWLGETATAESDELPDWLGTPAPITAEAEPADDLADWLAEPSDTHDDGMDWLGETATAEQETDTSDDDLLGWLATPTLDETDDPLAWLPEPEQDEEPQAQPIATGLTQELALLNELAASQEEAVEQELNEWPGMGLADKLPIIPEVEVEVAEAVDFEQAWLDVEPTPPAAVPSAPAPPTADPLALDDDDFAAQLIQLSASDDEGDDVLAWLMDSDEPAPLAELPSLVELEAALAEPDLDEVAAPLDELVLASEPVVEPLTTADEPESWSPDLDLLALPLDTPEPLRGAEESPDLLDEWLELAHSGETTAESAPSLDERLETLATDEPPLIPAWLLEVAEEEEPEAPAPVVPQFKSLEETLDWLEQIALADD